MTAATLPELRGNLTFAGWWLDLGLRDRPVVEMAAQRGAYTLWGIVPFVRLQQERSLGMESFVLDDPLMQRVMVSVVVNSQRIPGVREQAAATLQRFLIEPGAQGFIRQFRHHGLTYQTWWPLGRHNAGADLTGF